MSSAQDEADDGQDDLINNGESHIARAAGPDEDSDVDERHSGTLQEADPSGGEEERLPASGMSFRGYGKYSQEEQESATEASALDSRPVPARPSSADGSLSTPDDTPSIQVRPSLQIPESISLI